jgi:hypothetical protein
MWRRVQVAGFVLVALLVSGVWWNAGSQDNYDQRLTELEARVTLLEATVEALSGGPPTASSTATHTVKGTVTLLRGEGTYWERTSATGCEGIGNARRYMEGTRVWVDDWEGNEVATGELSAGRATSAGCTWRFSFEVPELDTYVFNVVGQEVSQDRSDLERSGWEIRLTVAA